MGAHPHQAVARIESLQGGEYQLTYSLGNLLVRSDDRARLGRPARAAVVGAGNLRYAPDPCSQSVRAGWSGGAKAGDADELNLEANSGDSTLARLRHD